VKPAAAAGGGRLRLAAGDARLEISPADGGRIASFSIGDRELLVTEGDGPIWWGAYPMVPFAGRIRHGEFRFQNRIWRLPTNMPPHAIHGHVLDRPWTAEDPSTISVRLADPWPFAGSVIQRFDLGPDGLLVTMELHADEPMPASLGWHPWFRRVVDGSGPVELTLEAESMFVRDAEGIPTGALVPPPPGPWDDCFKGLRSDPRLRWPSGPELTIGSSCDYWVVFTERDDAICVEPQTAPPDALNLDPTIVEPGTPLIATMEWRWR
jgi:aldose 1-epimerase